MQYMYIFGTDGKAKPVARAVSHLFQQWAQIKVYVYRQYDILRILCLTCHVQKSKQFPNCLKLVETSVVLIAFTGNLYHVRVYTVPFFTILSTLIRYQNATA